MLSSTVSSNPSSSSLSSLAPDSRLLLVSNRLPVAIKRSPTGEYTFTLGSGGLVSGLSGLSKSTEFKWYGWPGLEVPKSEQANLSERLDDEYEAVPVFLDDALADLYYNGFASEFCRSSFVVEYMLMHWYVQIVSSGPSYTTILAKSPGVRKLGWHIRLQIENSRKRSQRM